MCEQPSPTLISGTGSQPDLAALEHEKSVQNGDEVPPAGNEDSTWQVQLRKSDGSERLYPVDKIGEFVRKRQRKADKWLPLMSMCGSTLS